MGTAKITLDRFKNKLKQGGHVLSCTVPKVSHQRDISVVGRFNLGLQGFHGFTWKSGFIQGREDGDTWQLREQWCWFPHPSGLRRATGSHHSPLVPLHAHTHLMCRLGLIWAHKISNHSPNQSGFPPVSLLRNTVLPRWEATSLTQFSSSPSVRWSEIKADTHTHTLVSFHTL